MLLDYRPHEGRTLRELAVELDRTYYATRLRRKALLAGHVRPARPPACSRCGGELDARRHHGLCESCREDRKQAAWRVRYLSGSLATIGVADRRWARWTPEEDRRLLAESPSIHLARALGRTLKSCIIRRQRLLSR